MGKVTRRDMLRWGLATVGATVLAACAPKAAPTTAPQAKATEAPKAEAPTAAQPAPAGAITLRFITRQGDMGAAQREFATRYANESGGKIMVESEDTDWNEIPKKYETQMLAGTPPDLAVMDTAFWPYLAKRGSFLVIEDLVAEAKIDLNKWFNIEWMKRWTDGKLSGLGERAGINHIITFYNIDWVMSAWGKEPTDDWTMDDYVECMTACVKAKGEGYFGGNCPIGGGHVADGWVRNWGGFYMNPEGDKSLLTEEKCRTGLQWIADQVKNKNYPKREEAAEGETKMFFGGKQATLISNPGATTGMLTGAAANKINMGMCLAPRGPSAMENSPAPRVHPLRQLHGYRQGHQVPQRDLWPAAARHQRRSHEVDRADQGLAARGRAGELDGSRDRGQVSRVHQGGRDDEDLHGHLPRAGQHPLHRVARHRQQRNPAHDLRRDGIERCEPQRGERSPARGHRSARAQELWRQVAIQLPGAVSTAPGIAGCARLVFAGRGGSPTGEPPRSCSCIDDPGCHA